VYTPFLERTKVYEPAPVSDGEQKMNDA